jgi:amino acid adenylation domain-containing protein
VIDAERVTTLHFVPSMLQAFLDGGGVEGLRGRCASLRRVVCSGEALSSELAERFHTALGAELHNLYGPTEAAVDVTFWECTRGARTGGAGVPIGRPVANTQVYVLDGQMNPVPSGVAGELYIGGVQVGRGYLKRPALTAERFVPDPFSAEAGARLYRTGDAARYLSGGEIEYVGRLDQQVKVRGFRIELGEIEAALGRHPSVRECAVGAREDGAGGKRLVAYVVGVQGGQAAKAGELRGYLKERLPEYMIPSAFVALERMPLSPNGKLDRRALPAPSGVRAEAEEPYVAPGTMVEEVLAGIWSEVLGVEQVGVNDNYFALGGDSIRSLRVLALARGKGLEFTLQQLFRNQTVAELARELKTGAAPAAAKDSTPFGLLSEDDRAKLPHGLEDAYPLTTLQAGMFYHMRLMPGSSVYHNVNTWHLRARFDRGAFEEAVRRVVARHPVLRTSFDLATYSEPLQLVHREATLPILVEDLRRLPAAEQDAVLEAFIEGERRNHFDPSRAPLLRFFIHLRGEETFQFSLTESHPVNDGWSLTSTLAEVFGCYFALLDGEDPPRQPPPAVTFRDYVAQEREALDSEECRRYWDEKLSGATVMRLPRWPEAFRRHDGPRFYEVRVPVSEELTRGLKRVARAAKVPLKSVLLAAHLKVLSVVSGQSDVLGGIASNGRAEEAGGDEVRGLFLNTLPFRLDVSGGTWLDLIARTFEAEWEMLPHRRYPLVALQRRMNGQPLFETQFNYVHFHALEGVLGSGKVEILASNVKGVEETHFTLEADFGLDTLSDRIYLTAKGDATQLGVEQIKAAAGYYERALGEIAADPSARHDRACLLAPKEQRRLLSEWNETAGDYPSGKCLHELFEEQAARTPEAAAVLGGEWQLSYAELDARANQVARHLRALGVGAESRVGVFLERSAEMVVALLGVLKAGGAYVPLDPAYPQERLAFMLEDAQVTVLLSEGRLAEGLPPHTARLVRLDADREAIERESAEPLSGVVAPENLVYVIYTSGSTGRPKGVMVTHRGVVNCVWWMQRTYGLTARDRALFKTPLGFDASVWELFWPLAVGASLFVARPGGQKDTAYLARCVAAHDITTLYFVPSMLSVFLDERGLEELRTVRQVICGGESIAPETVERFHARLSAELHHSYGPTETSIGSAEWTCERQGERQIIPIGRPLANTQIYLLDAHMQPVPVGAPGEMYIGGTGVARGYLYRPELTAERFVPDPFSAEPGARLYKTGDLARHLPDGLIEFLGRVDHQVKLRGLRIELGEIEAVLAEQEEVKEAVVLAREDKPGDKRLVAYAVASGGERPTHGELAARLRSKLPDYMVPSAFVWLDAWPLMANGKVDRRRLPAPGEARPELETAYVAPRSELERLVAGVWQQVLQVERVGMHDNFFDLGGHSLRMLQVNGKLREALGREVSMVDMFQYPTVSALAEYLSRPEPAAEDAAEEFSQSRERTQARKRLAAQQRRRRSGTPAETNEGRA